MPKCISCRSSNLKKLTLYKVETKYFQNVLPDPVIYTCQKCHLSQIDHNCINFDQLMDYYEKYYRSEYRNNEKVDLQEDHPKFGPRARVFAEIIEKYFPKGPASIFELGAGLGFSLKYFEKRFHCRVLTDEPDMHFPSGIEKGHLDGTDQYDVILLSHVLEHLLNPAEMLANINKSLVKGGILIIEVPNDHEYSVCTQPDHEPHVTFFDQNTLTALFQESSMQWDIRDCYVSGAMTPKNRLAENFLDLQKKVRRRIRRVITKSPKKFLDHELEREYKIITSRRSIAGGALLRLVAQKPV